MSRSAPLFSGIAALITGGGSAAVVSGITGHQYTAWQSGTKPLGLVAHAPPHTASRPVAIHAWIKKILAPPPASSWLLVAKQTIDTLSTLDAGRNSYAADPPNASALYWARKILDILSNSGVAPAKIVPSAEGGVGICFIAKNKYADVECLNSGEIVAIKKDFSKGTREVWELDQDNVRAELMAISAFTES